MLIAAFRLQTKKKKNNFRLITPGFSRFTVLHNNMLTLLILSICWLQVNTEVVGDGYYSVIAPGTLPSGQKYTVAVAVHKTTKPTQLKVGITGPSYNDTKTVDLNHADVVQLVDFFVPILEPDIYYLTAEGLAGIEFHNATQLNVRKFEPHVMIEMDKGIYKPGDEVHYRVIVLGENLKPTQPSRKTVIVILDSKGNRIKEFTDLRFVNGVHRGNFSICEHPSLGSWTLRLELPATRWIIRQFRVKTKVLPRYEIKVEMGKHISVKDDGFQVVVRAKYISGEPVNGNVTLLIKAKDRYAAIYKKKTDVDTPSSVRTADMVHGKAKFSLNIKEYEANIEKYNPSSLEVTAVVEEKFTGVKLNSTASSLLFPYRYKMICQSPPNCYVFTPNQEEEYVITILHVDGSMLQDTKSIVRLIFVEKYERIPWRSNKSNTTEPPQEMRRFEYDSYLNASSQAVFKVKLPDLLQLEGYHSSFEGTVQYADEAMRLLKVSHFKKLKDSKPAKHINEDYLQIYVNYDNSDHTLTAGVEANFTVKTRQPIKYFIYTIVGRGNVVKTERIDLREPQNVTVAKFVPTFEMAPEAYIYVYYVDNGEYRYAEISAKIKWEFENRITIEVPATVKVGEEVSFSINTEPNSFVGLLATAQNGQLKATHRDVDQEHLRPQLGSFTAGYQRGDRTYPGYKSGVVTLTNAHYFHHHAERKTITRGNKKRQRNKARQWPRILFGGTETADFTETWIFDSIENTQSENFTWVKKVPDTITSWVVSGFSVNKEKGLATTKESKKIQAFQPFFVSVRLPYSVKRGEVVSLPVLVFNYLSKDLDVEVTLDNTDGEFEFTTSSNEVIDGEKRNKTVRVSANSAEGVSFTVRPKVIGTILLKLTAISPLAGDTIHKSLKVIPEGLTEYANRAFFMNLKNQPEANSTFELELPAKLVPDSVHAEFSVVGDLLGPLLNNLNYLVRLPTGCGEQTMSKLVPNYLMLRYLNNTDRLSSDLENRIKLNLERGYQNMLQFQHKDGSFSSFGPSASQELPRNGSTWLTAYTLRFLQKLNEYVNVDPKVISAALKFLNERQAANGSFLETGDYFYHSQTDKVSLTATACLALLETQNLTSADGQLSKGLQFIAENMHKADYLSVKLLAAFTLQEAHHPDAVEKFSQLRSLAKTDSDRRWWTADEKPTHLLGCCWWRWPRSAAVEATSYALLTLLSHEPPESEEVLQIVKWLVAQRNNYGGFASSHDTVVGLQALIKFAELSSYSAANMDVDFKTRGALREKKEALKLNKGNALLLQSFELPVDTRAVEFHARGSGAALVQISYQYNIIEEEPKPSFTLNTVLNKDVPPHKLELDVCVEWVGEGAESNMAVVEVTLPSGYEADAESFELLRKVDRVRHIEAKNSDTVIVVYFASLKKDDIKCLLIEAYKAHAVSLQKPAPVVAYDYYDTSKKATTYYNVVSSVCDICDRKEEECKAACV